MWEATRTKDWPRSKIGRPACTAVVRSWDAAGVGAALRRPERVHCRRAGACSGHLRYCRLELSNARPHPPSDARQNPR